MQNPASQNTGQQVLSNYKLSARTLATHAQLCCNTSSEGISPRVRQHLLQGILQASHAGNTAKQHTTVLARR
jgi:hypothetical protein